MAKVLGIHQIELNEGVSGEDFERFVHEEFLPAFPFPGWTPRLVKGDRGERAGKYALIVEIESTETRDRYAPGSNEFTEEGQRALEGLATMMTTWATFSPTIPGQNTTFTDYLSTGK